MKGARFRHLLFAVLLILAGCSTPWSGRTNTPPQQIYLLEGAQFVPSLQSAPGCHVLMVTSPRSGPGLATSGFAYRQNDTRVRYFAYHRWSDSPARMLHLLLVDAAERSNVFQGVVTPAAPLESNLRLDSEVVDLSQRFENGESHVRFAVRMRLFGEERLLASKVFEASEPAEPNPDSGIAAANRASARLLEEIMRVVQVTVQSRKPQCPEG